eukprot:8989466-Ditylum_brightwellii.AAC.1
MANCTGFFVNNTFALQCFTTVEGNLVEGKDHLGCVICKYGAPVVHDTGVKSSAKSTTFVFDHILIKRHPIARMQIFSGEFSELYPFGVCSAAQNPMHLGKYTGCTLGNWARVSSWLPSLHYTWTMMKGSRGMVNAKGPAAC